jgi:hypothetical protein
VTNEEKREMFIAEASRLICKYGPITERFMRCNRDKIFPERKLRVIKIAGVFYRFNPELDLLEYNFTSDLKYGWTIYKGFTRDVLAQLAYDLTINPYEE